jgi:hypothetical protein
LLKVALEEVVEELIYEVPKKDVCAKKFPPEYKH